MDAANFVFPNDLHVHWSMMIVLYPYITGIVAGAFIVSSLYHVFKVEALKPISRFSLLFALAFLAFATLPLLMHLGRMGPATTVPLSAIGQALKPCYRAGTSTSMASLRGCSERRTT